APAIVSSYDRAMPMRVEIAVPVALLAAYGLSRLLEGRRRWMASPAAGLGMASLIAISGTWIFDVVNARILAPSAAGLAMRAGAAIDHSAAWSNGTATGSTDVVRFLDEELAGGRLSWWEPRTDDVAALPEKVRGLLWTPGEQMESRIDRDVCTKRPALALVEISDRSGRTRLFGALERLPAASSTGDLRWTPRACGQTLETDATVAARALSEAAEAGRAGNTDDAIARLEQAAAVTLVQPRLYSALATLLVHRGTPRDRERARFWATLACRITDGADAKACALSDPVRRGG
ncbi:MAG TPA: hypothetical protein VEL28_07105, partial [Candidatus Binatia bacterium]|nr:hypothetical protein [Candidatus Binatia bacterium]